jgi:L-galactono-1,4-lactone dehydrogenase
LTYYYYPHPERGPRAARPSLPPDEHTLTNWSGTHSATTRVYVEPESLEELERVVKLAHEQGQRIRPVGSGLSPNGIGLSDEGMVNLALMDKVLSVDEETKRVRVQAGARVAEVVEALRPHGLTLQNYASIREQQIGGFIQVCSLCILLSVFRWFSLKIWKCVLD